MTLFEATQLLTHSKRIWVRIDQKGSHQHRGIGVLIGLKHGKGLVKPAYGHKVTEAVELTRLTVWKSRR